MSKTSELAAVLQELRHCGEMLIGVSETLADLFSGEAQPGQVTLEDVIMSAEPIPNPKLEEVTAEPEQPEDKPLSLEELRAAVTKKAQAGFKAEIKALLKKRNVPNVTAVPEADRAAFLAEVEAL